MMKTLIALVAVSCSAFGGHALWTHIASPGKSVNVYRDPKDMFDGASGGDLPSSAGMERLAKTDPLRFLENCITRYDREVKTGYKLTLRKQERVEGELKKKEILEVHFQESPHSIYMNWKEGAGLAQSLVFVDNGNKDDTDDPITVKSTLFGAIVQRNPKGADAKRAGRYTLYDFGLKKAMQRSHNSWKNAKEGPGLDVEYLGKQKIKEAGDAECWVLKRKYRQVERGAKEMTIFVDTTSWLQVGTILKDAEGKLVAEYFFRDIKLNPKFPEWQFTREALKR